MTEPFRVEVLAATHLLEAFSCGSEALDVFLQRHALANQRSDSARSYVICGNDRRVIAYYSLAVGAVDHAGVPSRIARGLARHPIPVMLLARLAVDRSMQGRGLGQALLKDAVLRTLQAAEIAGIRALLVHAKDDAARRWYAHFGFEPSPTDPLHLLLLMKDLRALVRE